MVTFKRLIGSTNYQSFRCSSAIPRALVALVCLLVPLAAAAQVSNPKGATKERYRSSALYGATTDARFSLTTPGFAKQFGTRLDSPQYGRIYPTPKLESVDFLLNSHGQVYLPQLPKFETLMGGNYAGVGNHDEFVLFSINPKLQSLTDELMKKVKAPHAAIVLMEPRTGRVLAISDKSKSISNLSLHSGFPAASIFKIITTSAALERSSLEASSVLKFRGGDYTLNTSNYKPDSKRDRRTMNLTEALGKSCNPVFARVALQYLSPPIVRQYTKLFGFNSDLGFDTPIKESSASIPDSDYQFSRTAAGFGAVTLSPVHATALISAVANDGLMPRPSLVDKIVDANGGLLYQNRQAYIQRTVHPSTAKTLLSMLQATTTVGTSKTYFMKNKKPVLGDLAVAAKTGTLRGKNPYGLNKWFVAAVPAERPRIAMAVIVVNPLTGNSRASYIGKEIIERLAKDPSLKG